MQYFSHPLIKEDSVEMRLYQERILGSISSANSMVVLPTGLGKTNVALLLAAQRLKRGKVLFMAPTRPLAAQHGKVFRELLKVEPEKQALITGIVPPAERERLYSESKIVFATPQTIQNDVITGRLKLSEFSLLIFDEAHRSVGEYPYPFIAEKYMMDNETPLILGLTASPGDNAAKIREICRSLHIENIEVRTEDDEDVKPYVQKKKIEWIEVELPEELERVRKLLKDAKDERMRKLQSMGVLSSPMVSKSELLSMRAALLEKIRKGGESYHFFSISVLAEVMKIEHGIELLETQGITALHEYFLKLTNEAETGKTKASKSIFRDNRIIAARRLTESFHDGKVEHPKLKKLKEIIQEFFENEPDGAAIIFAQYRVSVDKIYSDMKYIGLKPMKLIGQSGETGISQKEQISRIQLFNDRQYNVLIGTSVSEEGLDIHSVNLVVFYESVPSAVRRIQRAGRTGRHEAGRVVALITKGTRDQAFYWKSFHGEKRMKGVLKNMQSNFKSDKLWG